MTRPAQSKIVNYLDCWSRLGHWLFRLKSPVHHLNECIFGGEKYYFNCLQKIKKMLSWAGGGRRGVEWMPQVN